MYINLLMVLPTYLSPVIISKYMAKAKVLPLHDLSFLNYLFTPQFLMLQIFEVKFSSWTAVHPHLISKANNGGKLCIFRAKKVFGLLLKLILIPQFSRNVESNLFF